MKGNSNYKITNILKTYKGIGLILLIGVFVISLLQVVGPIFNKLIVDYGIANKNTEFIIALFFLQLFFILGQVSINILRNIISIYFESDILISFIIDFFKKIYNLDFLFFKKSRLGEITQRIKDIDTVTKFITVDVIFFTFSTLIFLVFSILFFVFSKILFFIFLLSSVFYAIWLYKNLAKRKKLNYLISNSNAIRQNGINEAIQGMVELKLQTKVERMVHIVSKSQENYIASTIKYRKHKEIIDAVTSFLNEIKNIGIIFFSAVLVIREKMSIGEMVSIQFMLGQMNRYFSEIMSFILKLQESKLGLDRINSITTKNNKSENKHKLSLNNIVGDIEFKDVSFRYPENKSDVINKINLSIPIGKKTLIIGESGSGKTTITHLLLGLYSQYSGNIKICNKCLNEIDLEDWRNQWSIVSQDNYIFHDSISNNISISDEKTDMSKVIEACQHVNLHSFIMGLDEKYDTILVNNAGNISKGQRQRVLLARAFYKKSNFLLLDEATNNLDDENRINIIKNLIKEYEGKTICIISHQKIEVDIDNIIDLQNQQFHENT